MTMDPRKTVAAAGFAIGLIALVLQFFVIVLPAIDAGRGIIGSVVYYFSFFTILTNIGLVLIYLGALVRGQRWLSFFRKPIPAPWPQHPSRLSVGSIISCSPANGSRAACSSGATSRCTT